MSLGSLAWFAITLYFHTPFMVLTLFRLCYSVCQCPQKKRIPVATKLEARKNTLINLFRKLLQSKSVLNFKVADSSEVLNDKTKYSMTKHKPSFARTRPTLMTSFRLHYVCTEDVRQKTSGITTNRCRVSIMNAGAVTTYFRRLPRLCFGENR